MTVRFNRPWAFAGALVAGICLLLGLPIIPSDGAGAEDAPVTAVVTPTTELGDGQLVSITIKSTGPDVIAAEMRICRSGVDYTTSTTPRPNVDFSGGGENCPDKPVSTSADNQLIDTTVFDNAKTAAGSVSKYRVGTGTVQWTNVFDQSTELFSCLPEEPCSLVVELRYGSPAVWHPVVVPLEFRIEDPVAGCGGPAEGALLGSGSDRIKDAWINWTLDECHQPDRSKAASRAVFSGEGPAIEAFAKGDADIAYTAAGYGDEVGLAEDLAPDELRPSIAVPIGVNAAVLAVAGGFLNGTGVKVPYDDLRLTVAEVAGLFSGGAQGIQPHYQDVFARNPELAGNFFDSGGSTTSISIAAPAEAEAESWIFTNYLDQLAPDAWKVPDLDGFGEEAGRDRGADAALAVADPTFALSIATLTGRPPLANANSKIVGNKFTQGGMWVLTDLETANALGMTPVKIANAAGEFVPVTPESIAAGVASMDETDNGYLLPDAHAVDEVDGVTPYPMTMIEYAMVPAEPLVDDDCGLRESSQSLLTSWLTYLTGRGQEHLPQGMLPLPEALQQRAESQIALVGNAETTGDCAGRVHSGVPTTTTTTVLDGGSTGGTTGGTSGGTAGGTPTTVRQSANWAPVTTVAAPLVQPGNDTDGNEEVALVSIPAFAGRRGISWFPLLIALLGVTGLAGLAGLAGGLATRAKP